MTSKNTKGYGNNIDRCNSKNTYGQSETIPSVNVQNKFISIRNLIQSDRYYNAEKLRKIMEIIS